MSTQEIPVEAAAIAAIDDSEAAFTEAAEVVKLAAMPEAHATLDAMCLAHERVCSLARTLVRA
jgi:hypothetical protein